MLSDWWLNHIDRTGHGRIHKIACPLLLPIERYLGVVLHPTHSIMPVSVLALTLSIIINVSLAWVSFHSRLLICYTKGNQHYGKLTRNLNRSRYYRWNNSWNYLNMYSGNCYQNRNPPEQCATICNTGISYSRATSFGKEIILQFASEPVYSLATRCCDIWWHTMTMQYLVVHRQSRHSSSLIVGE